MATDRPDILILSPDAGEYLPLLAELEDSTTRIICAATVEEASAAYSGQAIMLAQPDLAAELLDDMPSLRWLQSTWAGIAPLLACRRRDYLLSGIKDTFGPQMADYVLAYLLARELKIQQRFNQQQQRTWWEEASGTIRGKTLGIMGTGSIGAYIAAAATNFGMRVIGYNRSGKPSEGFHQVFSPDSLHDFLALPDYLVTVLPDTASTRHLLNSQAFRSMQNHCCLINVGRGNVIDEAALINALQAGELAGAVLDVFQQEPLPEQSPLWETPGLLVTGHIAASSWPADIARIFIENLRRYSSGKPLKYLIDFERGY